MTSSANSALVGLVVVISLVLLGGISLLVRGGAGFLGFRDTYYVMAHFDDATGITDGMSVTASGSDVGYVEKVRFNYDTGQTQVKLRLNKGLKLQSDAYVEVSQPGFLDERQLALQGLATMTYTGPVLEQGAIIPGHASSGLTELIAGQATEVTTLLTERLDVLLASTQMVLGSANNLMLGLNGLLDTNDEAISGTMKNMQVLSQNMIAMSRDLQGFTGMVSELAQDPKYRDRLDGLTENLVAVSQNMETMSAHLAMLSADPQLNADARATAAATRQSMEQLASTISGFQGTLGKVDTLLTTTNDAMGNVSKAAAGAAGIIEGVGGAVSGAKGKLGPGGLTSNIHMRFDMDSRVVDADGSSSYTDDDLSVRDMNATLGYNKFFAQFGVDNIGASDDFNFMVGKGDPNKGLSYKTGAYHGEVGTGLSYREEKNAGVDAYMYDSEEWKFDGFVRVPVGPTFSAIAGVTDIGGEDTITVGAGTTF